MTRRCWGAAAGATLWHLLGWSTLAGQATGALEIGVSSVRYEGFLGSGAVFAAPTLRYDAANLSLGIHGNLTVFESGNQILQGLAAAGWRTPPAGRFRGELSGSVGVSSYSYEDAPRYGHAVGRLRAHYVGARSGVWVGGATGQSFSGAAAETPYEVEVSAWTVYQGLGLAATVTRAWLADTAYLDAVATARWRLRRLELDGTAGFRTWSGDGGRDAYGELHLRVPLGNRVTVLASGGWYPSDPVRGVVAARYVSVALRIAALPGRIPAVSPLTDALTRERDEPGSPSTGPARLEIASSSDDLRTLRVEAPGAESVEIMGDFTDWQPAALERLAGGRWEITLPIVSGVHRLNVRLDGGPWLAPRGTRVTEDEFGSKVGILVVW
ncbi:MAG: hypothetical protein GTN78_05985 [Gemmatimonadales bacterium]|nr:hypothetical protein [Gemmatimonadales bacterium]NIN13277.1 hypothetical protein [Gemmatimonadales bacterium]NIQ99738.1 hypothetical protein [Gemmatimonadales bacterium]NIS64235.1 hypothetical protein [Gemmatimonadales bacterium]